ncbi:MAG: type II secretion system minor pseudopilin GspI [Chromatiales bacterium]|jgi:general secretion pathway protein I
MMPEPVTPGDLEQSGFTLIEVLVALVIAGTALIAVSTVVGDYSRNLLGLQERTWGHWAAMNQVVEFQLENPWPATGKKQGEDTSTPFAAHWKREISETPFGSVRKIELRIYRDKFEEEPLATLTTYTGKGSGW